MTTNKTTAKIAAQRKLAALVSSYTKQVKVNGVVSDDNVFLNAINTKTGKYSSEGIEVSGFLAKSAAKLVCIKFRPNYAEFDNNDKPLPDHVVMQNHMNALRKAAAQYEHATGSMSIPVLAKHLGDDTILFWKDGSESFRKALAAYTGSNISMEDVAWIRTNLEKGFKALSASVKPGTELTGETMYMVVLPSIGIAMDGAAVMMDGNPFAIHNSIYLGEGVQIRGFLRKMHMNSPWDAAFNYIKGVSWSLTAGDVMKVFDRIWNASPEEAREGLDLAKIRNWAVDHIRNVIITTSDVAKKTKPGVYAISHLMVNYFGHDKESARMVDDELTFDSVTGGVQVATRNFGFGSGSGRLGKKAAARAMATINLIKRATANWADGGRETMLKAFDRLEKVKDDDLESAAELGRLTSDFDEVHARLREVGITLEAVNYEGKFASACQSLVRKSLCVKARRAYRAYNLPSFLVEAVTGETMAEGSVYLPKDIQVALGFTADDFVLIGRDPRLWHALMPVFISRITTYLRGISEKAFIIDGFDTDGLRDQSDYDGDAKVIFSASFERFDLDAAIAKAIADLTAQVAWLKNGANIEELPSIKTMVASKVDPFFTCDPFDEIAMAYFSTRYAATGIERGDSAATSKAIGHTSMMTWDETVLVQKIIESVKHLLPGSKFFMINYLSQPYRSTSDGLFFALKSKKETAVVSAILALGKFAKEQDIDVELTQVIRAIDNSVPASSRPLVEAAAHWAFLAVELDQIPQSGSAYFAKTPVRPDDQIINWLIGDKRLAAKAGAIDPMTGMDYVLSGKMRLFGEYRDAVQNHAKVRSNASRCENAVEASELIAAAAAEVTLGKQIAKRRVLDFAHVIADWAEKGIRIAEPTTYQFRQYTNYTFDDESKRLFTESMESIGLDFTSDVKAVNAFWTMSRKMGKYYQLWNTLVQRCAESEDSLATAIAIVADVLFRNGHSLDENGLPMKDFLYFIGENAVVELRRSWAAIGHKVDYYLISDEAKLRSDRNNRNRSNYHN